MINTIQASLLIQHDFYRSMQLYLKSKQTCITRNQLA